MWVEPVLFDIDSDYGYVDLNRVNGNIIFVQAELAAKGYVAVLPKPTPTNYSRTSFPYVTAINDARQNILAIIAAFYDLGAPTIAVNPARLQIFDYILANALELNLKTLHEGLAKVLASLKYAGTFRCGEDRTNL